MSADVLSKRECVLIEAAKIFARFGFKKTSIDDIAKEAGVGKGTVYLAAESKEELFYQVLHREVRHWQAACAKVIDPRVPADELLFRLYAEAQRHLASNNLVRDLFRGEMVRMLPKWAARFEELRAIGKSNVVEVLRIGIPQGAFRGRQAVGIRRWRSSCRSEIVLRLCRWRLLWRQRQVLIN